MYRSFLFYHHLTDKTYVIFLQIKDHIKRDCHQSSSSASRGQDAEICSDQQLAPGAQGAGGLTGRRAGTNQVSSGRRDIFNRTIHTPEPGCVCPILLVNGFRKVDNFLTTVCKNIKASGDEVQIVWRNLLLFHFDGGRHSRQPKTRSLKVNFGKLDSTLSHLFSVLGCYRTIHTGLCLWKVESCSCMWEQSRWKSFKS